MKLYFLLVKLINARCHLDEVFAIEPEDKTNCHRAILKRIKHWRIIPIFTRQLDVRTRFSATAHNLYVTNSLICANEVWNGETEHCLNGLRTCVHQLCVEHYNLSHIPARTNSPLSVSHEQGNAHEFIHSIINRIWPKSNPRICQ